MNKQKRMEVSPIPRKSKPAIGLLTDASVELVDYVVVLTVSFWVGLWLGWVIDTKMFPPAPEDEFEKDRFHLALEPGAIPSPVGKFPCKGSCWH